MRLSHRGIHPLVAVSVLLCALLVPTPASASEGPGASAEVARLYEEASAATVHYEAGQRAAEVQRAEVRKLDRLLTKEQHAVAVLHGDLGRMASAQYRTGGGLPQTAQLLLADSPEELMRGQRVLWQADLAVNNAVIKTQRAAARLADAKHAADRAKRTLDRRNAHLAKLKRGIESKLASAQWALQGEADRSVAAGQCRGAVRLEQPQIVDTRAWVPPVETYELSAGFGSAGARWASRHTGQDFAVGIGAPVRSVGAGRVVKVSCGGAFGIEVVVEHEGGYYTQYAHLSAVTVDQGELVAPGQWVGQAGTTGNSTGPHLHFEVRLTPYLGSGIDPATWLAERGVPL
ncbi:peptidoglycan DD-metalloendopeptidase family protein [Streptomyces sp. NBC_01381]|uniref:M23 family metallopeptidase n=1 Tax=Streptomyces sp. NBC_01381 TaxID=2903845 RepID=UPI002250BE5A|nr:M23 family metallopeptidase [Streptomyces sp. NBC_01381]MCX4665852.1 peptidoglycan DD-metalloendopeptidase family protein [Streptomyces sp. NBC_01381]